MISVTNLTRSGDNVSTTVVTRAKVRERASGVRDAGAKKFPTLVTPRPPTPDRQRDLRRRRTPTAASRRARWRRSARPRST